jgi:hypothetical protein
MKPVKPVATVGLLFLAIWLGLELSRVRLERTTHQADVAAQTRELANLRTQLDAARADRAATATLESQAANTPADAKATSNVPAAPRPLDPRIANRAQEMSRRNALQGYIAGFDRLRLPSHLLEQAKAIILARTQASAAAPKPSRSMAEALEEINRLNQAMDDQLTALLGAEATAQLRSAAREDSIDWAIGTDLWDAGARLSPSQLEALARAEVQVGYEPYLRVLPESPDQAPDHRTGLNRQNADLLAATSDFLSPAQQAILQRSLIEDQQYNAAMRAFGEKQKKLSGSR